MDETIAKAIDLTLHDRCSEALLLFEKEIPNLSGSIPGKRLAGTCFSFYGLCVAKIERKYGEAVKCCEISIKTDHHEASHFANLAEVYVEAGDPKKAIETLRRGLRIDSKNRRLRRLWIDLGVRKQPVLGFLQRDHPLNIWLGNLLRGRR